MSFSELATPLAESVAIAPIAPIVVFDRNLISSMELSRAHKGRRDEKKDARMPYKQGGNQRDIIHRKNLKGSNGGNSSHNGNGGSRPH